MDKLPLDGAAYSYIGSVCTKLGIIRIVGVFIAERIQTIAAHLQSLETTLFVDLELA